MFSQNVVAAAHVVVPVVVAVVVALAMGSSFRHMFSELTHRALNTKHRYTNTNHIKLFFVVLPFFLSALSLAAASTASHGPKEQLSMLSAQQLHQQIEICAIARLNRQHLLAQLQSV